MNFRRGLALLVFLGIAMSHATPYQDAQTAYRKQEYQKAVNLLTQQLKQNPSNQDVRILLAFSYYQLSKYDLALDALKGVDLKDPDAAYAKALILGRTGKPDEARVLLQNALKAYPGRQDLAQELKKYPAVISEKDLPPYKRPAQLRLPYTLNAKGFQTASGKSIEVKGVNFGVALPGKFPSEFPEKSYYQQWIKLVGDMNGNVIRAYTILPPSFYEALLEYNTAHKDRPIYLIHGVWTELPENDDYQGAFEEQFYREATHVINVLHGRAAIQPVPGHASGLYTSDVSPYLLGIIIGREWEPFSVMGFNERAPNFTSYQGTYLKAENVLPMEAWLARIMDRIIKYQVDTYNQQTPIAFTNWPTLDPMTHITETTRDEENAIRRKLGEQFEKPLVNEFNNDEVGLDALKIEATTAFKAGQFASYHAYPYYPDFMNLDAGYSAHPVSNYQGYLEELKRHYGNMPILISEIGVPSSRSVAHFQNQGYTHGGHSEAEQARIDVELFKQIKDTGLAGGILFALLDEWFKRNWLYMDFELPADHNPRWLNIMDAEQNYGVIAAEDAREVPLCAAPPKNAVTLDNQLGLKALATSTYLHFWLPTTTATTFQLDTHPDGGYEYQVNINPTGITEVKVNAAYAPFIEVQDGSYRTLIFNRTARPKQGAEYVPIVSQPNRLRFSRDEKLYPRKLDFPGILKPGDESKGRDATRDYCASEKYTHVRLPWTLINVTDPSSRFVLDLTRDEGYLQVPGIRMNWKGKVYNLTWDTWENPPFKLRVKPVFDALKNFWAKP
ncbi:tetratricopeptide repeat protein [Deinococcus cellulosilyticus]|uniref:Tetratricopeptide repeat protein n=1 Tax=Deinococcus cellulosilyticus (strain DSM 18568 / NBRC 106333 / KACC 11606 / 5516J-15) TaxID=1223518 RepID=A0A511MWL1_DEIC1|nr:tetratricopeptide repeat protein [Deinococcus cellulosilyticus]GEM44950.1 hypothetical protein DC3_05850 [Deinococcus cellulosilyticus NBRC 106333 = KACC 11606]